MTRTEMTRIEKATRRAEALARRLGPQLRWLAGTRAEVLDRIPGDKARYTALGALLVGTAVIATVSMWLALGQVSDAGWLFSIPLVVPALVWGGFILLVDRALITGVTTSRWRRSSTLAVRLVMAGALGVVIAEPLVLQVFGAAIEARINTQRATEVDDLRTGLLRCNPVPATKGSVEAPAGGCEGLLLAVGTYGTSQARRVAQLQDDAATLERSLNSDAARQQELTDKAQNECSGVAGRGLSGVVGYGRLCIDAQAAARDFATANPVQPRQSQLDSLRQQIDGLRGPAADSAQSFEATRNRLIDDRVAQLVAARPAIGLLERFDALDSLTSVRPGLLFREWFVRIFLIVIDCMPVLVKFIGGITAYDRAAERELGKDRDLFFRRTDSERTVTLAEIRADEEMRIDDIDAKRRRHNADRKAEEEQQIAARTTRLEHMFGGGKTEEQPADPAQKTAQGETKMEEGLIQSVALLAVKPLIQAMGDKAWAVVRDRWASVLGKHRPGGPEVAAELDESAERLASGRATPEETRDEWYRRVADLLRERPDLKMEVRGLYDEPKPPTVPAQTTNGTRQRANVRNGISVQSGRDTTVGGDLGDAPEPT
jgi:hypothetical protein